MIMRWTLAGITVAATILVAVGLQPVPQPTSENTETVSAVVTGVQATESFDIFFEVTDHDGERYYINRGVEHGLDARSLEALVRNKVVDLTYVKHRSLFDPAGRSHHLIAVSCGDSLIFAQ